ncbi:globin [Puteibacter caeruleilacunae]|nr:globin [Puteibacter caeruleilacunae]
MLELKITPFKLGWLPEITMPDKELLKLLGEEGMRQMISDHYDLLRESEIKGLFPAEDEEFEAAKKRSSDFFIQIMGGPQYFNQNRGRPMLTKRHAPFKITPEAREVWLQCYQQVLQKQDLSEDLIMSFWNYLDLFSVWMVNSHDKIKL